MSTAALNIIKIWKADCYSTWPPGLSTLVWAALIGRARLLWRGSQGTFAQSYEDCDPYQPFDQEKQKAGNTDPFQPQFNPILTLHYCQVRSPFRTVKVDFGCLHEYPFLAIATTAGRSAAELWEARPISSSLATLFQVCSTPGLNRSTSALLAASMPIETTFLVSRGSMIASTQRRAAA